MKTKPTLATITRTAVLFIVLTNQVIVLFGGNPLPFEESKIYEAVSTVLTVGVSLLTWWKNQSFSEAAILGDELKDELKEAETKARSK